MRIFIFILIYLLLDIYGFQAVRTLNRSNWLAVVYFGFSVLLLGALIYQSRFSGSPGFMAPGTMYVFGLFLAFLIPKLFLIVFMFGEDIVRLSVGLFSKIAGSSEDFHLPSRRRFISSLALGIAAIPFASLVYGMFQGKYNYKVLRYTLEFDDLPSGFDGYTITQISDIHSGSFDNAKKVRYAVNLVNEQKSDLILFTGDLVNNVVEEMDKWKSDFSSLFAKDGVFSILGNHDYGDYVNWESKEAKERNMTALKELQGEMGWNLLLNENRTIHKDGDSIRLIGVENWGEGGFKKAGDLDQACQGVDRSEFKILMSHDPSHWNSKVRYDNRNIQLTLSGHTHGMQFGIEIPGLVKWSPVKYRYENWAGIYKSNGRYINVNRGFGFIGYPGRVGIWPEITVITLKKARNTA